MRSQIVVFTLFVASLGIPSRAAEPWDQLRVGLDISPQSTLPGIPVTFRITFANPMERAVALPPHALLIAMSESGDAFPLRMNASRIYPDLLRTTPVPAGGTAVIEIRPRGSFNDEPFWTDDARLNHPGKFQIHVVIGKFMQQDGVFLVTVPEGGVRSSDVQLQVLEPTGVDLEVWHEMLMAGKGQWAQAMIPAPAGRTLALRVVRQFPDSAYAGWFAARGVSDQAHESADALRAWLSRASRDQYTEARELQLALFDEGAARGWLQIGNEDVIRHLRYARALLEKLKDSKDQQIASVAAKRLVDLAALEADTRERIPRVP
jgi:hypothetical protein